MKRSNIREAAFMLIFEKLFKQDSCDEIAEAAREADEYELCEESEELFEKVCERADELDALIGEFSEKRRVSRIGRVSLAVLRLAVYEALYEEAVPTDVAISEAVRLSQTYSLENDTQFVNGLLGALARSGRLPEDKKKEAT